MGLVRDLADRAEADAEAGGEDRRTPSHGDDSSPDPFLRGYDTEHVQLDDRTADRILGLIVVLSNLAS